MKLYLSSNGLGNKTNELENWNTPDKEKMILITNALDTYEENVRKIEIATIQERLSTAPLWFDLKTVSLKDYFGKSDQLKQEFKNYHSFFVLGGNVFALRKAMQLSGFDKFLKEISDKDDYLYGGYSAGICVLSPSLRGFELVDEPINPYNNDGVLYDGIGLLNYMPIPHYNPVYLGFDPIGRVVRYCRENNINYKTIKDGDVIIKEIENELER